MFWIFQAAILALAAVASAQQFSNEQPPIAILRQSSDASPDGSYAFSFEAENGIAAQESGAPGPLNEEGQAAVVAQGQYRYTAPDGTPVDISYVANENGFQPQGSHIPVPPPIPEAIQRALDYIAAHPPKPESNQRF